MGITKSDKIEKARVDDGKNDANKMFDRSARNRKTFYTKDPINKPAKSGNRTSKRGDDVRFAQETRKKGMPNVAEQVDNGIKSNSGVQAKMYSQNKPNLPKSEDTRSNDEIFNADSKSLGGPNTGSQKDVKALEIATNKEKGKKKDLNKWGSSNASGFGAMVGAGTKSNPTIKPTESTSSSVRSGTTPAPKPAPTPSVGWGKSEETMDTMKKAEAMIEVFEKLEELDGKAGEILEKAKIDVGMSDQGKRSARGIRNLETSGNVHSEAIGEKGKSVMGLKVRDKEFEGAKNTAKDQLGTIKQKKQDKKRDSKFLPKSEEMEKECGEKEVKKSEEIHTAKEISEKLLDAIKEKYNK